MAIISFDKDALIDYAPEYGGNRDSDIPCIVRLRFVPYSKLQQYSRLIALRNKDAKSDVTKAIEAAQAIQKKQFVESVEGVSGFLVNGREVADPAEFYETADTDLILEIIRAMESSARLTEGQRKNS